MDLHQVIALALAATGAVLGFLGTIWHRCGRSEVQVRRGSRVFLGSLVLLGLASLDAFGHLHEELVYVGLILGSLILAMLWEAPQGRSVEMHEAG